MNIVAPFCRSGYGYVASNLTQALSKKLDLSLFPIGQVDLDPQFQIRVNENYSFKNPSLRVYHQFSMAEHVGCPRMGYPVFEKTFLTKYETNQLRQLDLVFSPTAWQARILTEYGIDSKVLPYGWTFQLRPYVKPPSITTFVCIGKWELRKGQDFSVRAFNAAFKPKDDVRLIMHCDNHRLTQQENAAWEKMCLSSPMGEKIKISHRLDSGEEVARLMQSSTCGLFLSRAEGWNLEASEMLALGRQIICTDYSGHTEFATYANANLVRVGTERAVGQVELEGGDWARLDDSALDQTVHYMRQVHNNNQVKNVAGINGAEYATWDRATDKLLETINAIR